MTPEFKKDMDELEALAARLIAEMAKGAGNLYTSFDFELQPSARRILIMARALAAAADGAIDATMPRASPLATWPSPPTSPSPSPVWSPQPGWPPPNT